MMMSLIAKVVSKGHLQPPPFLLVSGPAVCRKHRVGAGCSGNSTTRMSHRWPIG